MSPAEVKLPGCFPVAGAFSIKTNRPQPANNYFSIFIVSTDKKLKQKYDFKAK